MSPPSPQSSIAAPLFLSNNENQEVDTANFIFKHSQSLLNRTPPKGSLAADLLTLTPRPDVSRKKALVSEMKDCFSDFGSCVEMSDDDDRGNPDDLHNSSDENNSDGNGYQTMNEKKRMKRNKRKLKVTPGKEQFLKKPNLVFSPTEI